MCDCTNTRKTVAVLPARTWVQSSFPSGVASKDTPQARALNKQARLARQRCAAPASDGFVRNSSGQGFSTSGVQRARQQVATDACYLANRVAQSPTELPWDKSRSTPSGLASCASSHSALIAQQSKAQVMAAQGCAAPSRGLGRAPIWSQPAKPC